MSKKFSIVIIILLIFLISGCKNNRFYLEDKYYKEGKLIEINSNDFKKIEKESYILFTYNNYCKFSIPCDKVFEKFVKKYNISIVSIKYDEFKKISLNKKVKYAPSLIIVNKGKVIDFLDANSNNDVNKYQDLNELKAWINKYIYLNKEKNESL